MPKRSKKPCSRVGCSNLIDGNKKYCKSHEELQENNHYDKYRGTAAQRGYNAKWRKARTRFLSMNHLCVECSKEFKITVATVVDHIIPHKGDYALFWDETNWQPLCKKHHDIKTATNDGGFGRKHPPTFKS